MDYRLIKRKQLQISINKKENITIKWSVMTINVILALRCLAVVFIGHQCQ